MRAAPQIAGGDLSGLEHSMTNHVAGKSIVITGAGSGFGRLTAKKAAALGGRVTCVDVNAAAAEATAAEIKADGGEAQSAAADVVHIDEVRAAAKAAVAAYGAIDVMVNNAGIMPLAFIADHEKALGAWSRCIDINFKGVMNGTVAVYDQMIAQGRGQVVNLSSIFGNRPAAGGAVYGATKAAVDYFSHALRQESRGKIKVTVVKPSGVSSTGLGGTVVNGQASVGILGQNMGAFFDALGQMHKGEAPPEWTDRNAIDYMTLDPEAIADAIIHAIDQPWGVNISDITVRATGDHYLL
jgi:NADP-dependent 3-hydroxy acid dehydrogenase YdfG